MKQKTFVTKRDSLPFLLQLLQRFRIEYDGEPLELYQKVVAVPGKPVKIKFVDRVC